MRFLNLTGLVVCLLVVVSAAAQPADTATVLFEKLRSRLNGIDDYTADVNVKIDVSFMKVPVLKGKLYFKAPDKMLLERGKGISILPKKNVSLTLNSMLPTGAATVIDAGKDVIDGRDVRVIKVVPHEDVNQIILTKIWVDEQRNLALRTESTTRDNGTVKMDLSFGDYMDRGLPDKVVVHLDVKEYKLPKGVTMDYDTGGGSEMAMQDDGKRKKGTIEIKYLNYELNKGLSDDIFAEKE